MNTYRIYVHPQGDKEAVKLGWSWPAFLFGAFWALFKKLWIPAIGLFLLFFVLNAIEYDVLERSGKEAAQEVSGLLVLLSIIFAVLFGVNGNRWRVKNLEARGYEPQGTIDAANPEAAIALWMKGGKKQFMA